MGFEDGPFVQIACFCETVIEDKNGVLSLIRIVDTLIRTHRGTAPPEEMPPFTKSLKMVISLKAGKARGRHSIKMAPELPNGSAGDPYERSIHLEGEEKGHNHIVDLTFQFPLEGLYWFDIYFDEKKITALPLRVKYDRIVTGALPQAS